MGQSFWENRLLGLATFDLRGLRGRYDVFAVKAVANRIAGLDIENGVSSLKPCWL
jgi:hypothetical protein